MRFFARLLIFFLLLSGLWSLLSSKVYAQGEFTTDYKVQYSINPSGATDVTQQIVLKNNTANFYADKFELKIGSTKVENVKAQDSVGPMPVDVKFENNVTSISVKFNQRVIGIGKTLPWTLSYTSSELATKSGQIWEVSIPKVADSGDIGDYSATVNVPKEFGPIAFAVPEAKQASQGTFGQSFSFDRDQLTKSGIAMSFGEKQVFSFSLNYYLENQNLTTQTQQITLPPDNNYQKIVLDKLDPAPMDVAVDADGNFVAKYRLLPKQRLDITASGSVEVFSKPFRNLDGQLSKQQRDLYLQPQKYWEVDNPLIGDKAAELKTPQKIYDYVSSYLSYSQDRLNNPKLERKGAVDALNTPRESVCMEFTDLFIALARAANIPAREVEGFAYTQNDRLRPLSLSAGADVLHAWPEYWDDQLGWVQVDPTWGSTSGGLDYFNKLDFNHVTFIQRGSSSVAPYPPGAYKRRDNEGQKSVFLNFSQELPDSTLDSQLDLSVPPKIISGVPIIVFGKVQNVGKTSFFNTKLSLLTNLRVLSQADENFAILPPYAKRSVEFRLQTNQFLSDSSAELTLAFADKFVVAKTTIVPIYNLFISPTFIIGVAVAIFIVIGGFYLYRRFHLRRAPRPRI
ncbi:MAG TPA: transglutaminase domain-containing protein [Candidatus Saccharimonadales bacterium]|nr:transglutaminase domain-containing protein [Candidatus Saccharimonadales bacterium]